MEAEPGRAFNRPTRIPSPLIVVYGCSVPPVFMELNNPQLIGQQRNVRMPGHANLSPLTEVDLEHDPRRFRVRGDRNYGCHTTRICTRGWCVHLLAEDLMAELLDQLIGFHGSFFYGARWNFRRPL